MGTQSTWDQLSRDPASLSNLDQVLPNYAQPQIPIFSLPQDWLWCESWCSDASKATAKTIDLQPPGHEGEQADDGQAHHQRVALRGVLGRVGRGGQGCGRVNLGSLVY